MIATQQFIEDAVKGGWRPHWHWDEDGMTNEEIIESLTDYEDEWYTNYYGMIVKTNHPFLDPLAWQAVGKTRGWFDGANDIWKGEIKTYNSMGEGKQTIYCRYEPYQWNMHCFIDHLADGKTIEEALTAIN